MSIYGEKVFKFCAFILFLFCVFKAVTAVISNIAGTGDVVGGIFGVLECVVWAVIAGIIFVLLFLSRVSSSFTGFLFGGSEHLDKVPVSLSGIRNAIHMGDIEQAAIGMEELYALVPKSPELNLLMFEFYLDECNNREFAFNLAGNYLRTADVCAEENMTILLRYCDLCLEKNMDVDEITDFLLDQSTRKIYREADMKRIFERVKGLNS